ncbi:TRAP transporter small permease [Thalassovita gelatinovora]|nr:TRAP transporter small permease subunit [Thalassovita gelatinovora]
MEAACLLIAVLCLLYMVFVVGFNVLARIIFDFSDTAINLMIPGAIEQVSYLLGIIALAALSASMAQGMIAVDFVIGRLPSRWQSLAARFWFVGIFAFALVLCSLFYEDMIATFARGEATQDLRIPMFLIYGLYAVECLALAVVALREALTNDGQHAELS